VANPASRSAANPHACIPQENTNALQPTYIRESVDPLELFGDGPPRWTMNKGKLGERPSFSSCETIKERDATPFRHRRRGNYLALLRGNQTAMSPAALAFAHKLGARALRKRSFDRNMPKGLGR
jgi:hypothetical protein